MIDNAGVQVQTTHDVRGRSDRFIWTGGGISPASVDIDRNGRGQITSLKRFADSTLTNQVSRTTYDQIAPQGWVKQIQHKDGTGALYNAGTNFTYSYDFEGQVTGQSSQGNSTTYTYDPTGQLLTANHSAVAYPDEFYNYDKSGNRTSSHLHAAYTTGTANRLQSDGQFNYGYDAEGNMTTRTEITTGKATTFTYDHRGRTTSIIERASAGGAVLDSQIFVYDALDRRITINAKGSVTNILYHGDNAWADYAAGGAVSARYLFADRIDANLAKYSAVDGTTWYHTDKLDSMRGLSAANGNLLANFGYDSFGNKIIGSSMVRPERFGFTGREIMIGDFIFYRSREYSSTIGRFIVEDRIAFEGMDSNLFRYVGNSPQNFIDPEGKQAALEYTVASAIIGGGMGFTRAATCETIMYFKGDSTNQLEAAGRIVVGTVKGALVGAAMGAVFYKIGIFVTPSADLGKRFLGSYLIGGPLVGSIDCTVLR